MQHWLEAFSYEALSQCKDIPVGFGVWNDQMSDECEEQVGHPSEHELNIIQLLPVFSNHQIGYM